MYSYNIIPDVPNVQLVVLLNSYCTPITRTGEPEPEPEPGVFGSLEPEPESLKKNQEPEPLGKKVRSRSR